jgi:histidinol-phosphate aminotransferase
VHAWDLLLRPELAQIAAYVPSHATPTVEAERSGQVTKLDANEAPLVERPRVLAAMNRAIAATALERYPDARATELRGLLATLSGAHADEILVGTGSDEVIALLVTALARPRPGRARAAMLTFAPSFVMYDVTARAHGFEAVLVPLDGAWDLDMAPTAAAIRAALPNLIFVASPNNPTGNRMSDDRVAMLLEVASEVGAIVVLDEAYVDFSSGSRRGLRARYENLVVLRTLSKVGLAALRIGWLEAHPALVREVDKARQPYNVSATSQAAAVAVLREAWSEVTDAVRVIAAERGRVAAAVAAMPGFVVTPSEANFLWVRTPRPAAEVASALRARGVLVRAFGGGDDAMGVRTRVQLRVTIGAPAENDRFLAALAASAVAG